MSRLAQNNGRRTILLTLSQAFIEELADSLLKDYYGSEQFPLKRIDIDDFATRYMKMKVRYENFDCQGKTILGVTAYENTTVQLDENNPSSVIPIDSDTILLNQILSSPEMFGRRNFTLGHECGHQAIFLLQPIHVNLSCRVAGMKYSLRELRTENDWNEWQANIFAAALLMPKYLIEYFFYITKHEGKVVTYPCGRFLHSERNFIKAIASFLGVSQQAIIIRLKQLGFTEQHPDDEYFEKYDIEWLKWGLRNGALQNR